MDSLDPVAVSSLVIRILYNFGVGLAGISVGIFVLVAIGRAHAFLKWRSYAEAGRTR